VTVHYPSPNQLEEQVEGLLELVIKPRLPDRRVHGPRHWRMIMGFQQKTVSRRQQQGTAAWTQMRYMSKKKKQVNKLAPRINYAIGAIQAPMVSQTPGKKKYVPSELKETPYHVCNHLILLFQCW
jgi:hypothetical protein